MKFKKKIIFIFLFSFKLFSIDNAHFYRASYFWGEPRFATDWFSTADISFSGGATKKSRAGDGKKTSLLNIYGLHNMQILGKNVQKDPNDPLDNILQNLENTLVRDGFGQLKFNGRFSVLESYINVYQNLKRGFFFQINFPIRRLRISKIDYEDLSPDDNVYPNKNTPVWQDFLNNFDDILARYDLDKREFKDSGVGDVSLLIGWAKNYQKTEILDFFDFDIKIGVLFPTGKEKDIRKTFGLPLGYGGFWGFPFKTNFLVGVYDWLNVGFHVGGLFLFKDETELHMKTSEEQNGFIKLAKGKTKFDYGDLLDLSMYLKADHFVRGLSLLFGYSFNKKEKASLDPFDKNLFDPIIVNDDTMLKGWSMYVLNFFLEYDFAKQNSKNGAHVGIMFNYPVGGKRIFKTGVTGAYLGLDIALDF